jgi:predicted Zn-dependent protease
MGDHVAMRLARLALILLSLAAGAWFVLGVVQARDLDRATDIVQRAHSLRPAQADQARSLLDTAATLHPNRSVGLLRAQVASLSGHPHQAVRLAERVTAQEPQNLNAWLLLAQVALHGDRSLTGQAVARLKQLDPRLTG